MKASERAGQIRAVLEWNGNIVLPQPAMYYIADIITHAEKEAFEAGYRYGRRQEQEGMAYTFEDWEGVRRLAEGEG